MASLMENLVQALDEECTMYEKLLGLSSRKTAIIVSGDLKALAEITDEEQCAKHMNLFTLQKYEKVESKLPTIKIIFYTFVL